MYFCFKWGFSFLNWMPLEVVEGGRAPPATLAEKILLGAVPIELFDMILYYLCIPSTLLQVISLRR